MMTRENQPLFIGLDEDAALRAILQGTATETGKQFFTALVAALADVMHTKGAWVTEYVKDRRLLRMLAFRWDGQWVKQFELPIDKTPCEVVITETRLVHYPDGMLKRYPHVSVLRDLGVESYMGVPLQDTYGRILGHLAVLDTRAMPEQPRSLALFRIFAARATAELQRLQAEAEVREHQEQLSRLIDSAMDAIMIFDGKLQVIRINAAVEKIFQRPRDQVIGKEGARLFTDEGWNTLRRLISEFDARPSVQWNVWVPGHLKAVRPDGATFSAEATLSRFEMNQQSYYTVILRNIDERIEAERKIQLLTVEAENLRENLKALQKFDEIIGRSPAILQVLRDVDRVAKTDATVLITGETGTGKEGIARAIHTASRRRYKPIITVNCATIPSTLIESEFFGHVSGAFTGATQKRKGRFALADGGTILLDEIGELPVDLQAKLLRVLQEGSFEPVGSSRTERVDVRVLAATNRDLDQAVQSGEFREDLYYRLNVFPLKIPPLREREGDIVLLAAAFANRAAKRMGQKIEPLSEECIRRLNTYDWPGNVRELQNVIERAVITAQDGRLNLERALPECNPHMDIKPEAQIDGASVSIKSSREIRELERNNMLRALEATGWRITGEHGAARLLGIPPSTLRSRMKALALERPAHR